MRAPASLETGEELRVTEDIFEIKRWSPQQQAWGSDYPTFLCDGDPHTKYVNRLGQDAGDLALAERKCLDGWKWVDDDWLMDHPRTLSSDGTTRLFDDRGWMYAEDFPTLARQLLWRTIPAKAPPTYPNITKLTAHMLPVCWRRWSRTRERLPSAGTARGFRVPSACPGEGVGGWREEIPESAILHEGWLSRFHDGEWVQRWGLLARTADGNGALLLYFLSPESMLVVDDTHGVRLAPPASLAANERPPIPRDLALVISEEQLACCFGVGDARAVEGDLHCAPSAGERAGWVSALRLASESTTAEGATGRGGGDAGFGDLSGMNLPGAAQREDELSILCLGASGLAATERDGTTDAYVKLTLKGAKKTRTQKTKVVRGTVHPRWDEALTLQGVESEGAQVLLHVKDWNLTHNTTLGEVSFPLSSLRLPTSGAPVTFVLSLHDVTEGATRNKKKAQGQLRVRIGWNRGGAAAGAAAAGGGSGTSSYAAAARHLVLTPDGEGVAPATVDETDAESAEEKIEELQAKQAREAKEAEAQRRKQEAMTEPPKKGEYQLCVHVLEGRDLVGRDANGVSDAMVEVSWLGVRRRTATKYKQISPLWDEQLFITADDLDETSLNRSQIQVAVYDKDLLTRDLVGQFFFDATTVYYEKDHEIWRKWVTLTAPHSERKRFFGKDAHGGVQGYLKLSLTLLGPDDPPNKHEEEEEEEEAAGGAILLPPTLKRRLVYLRIDVLCASHLPRMDSTGTAGIDAYAKIRFNGYKVKTAVQTTQNPEWLTMFLVPTLVPTIGGVALVEVRDKDVGPTDDTVGIVAVSFDEAMKRYNSEASTAHEPLLRWHHLYAPGTEARALGGSFGGLITQTLKAARARLTGKSGARALMKEQQEYFTSEWRGKLLLSVGVYEPDVSAGLPEKALQRQLPRPPPGVSMHPPECIYELRACVLAGYDLSFSTNPSGASVSEEDVYIEAAVEHHVFRTDAVSPWHGFASFLTADDDVSTSLLKKVNSNEPLLLASDRAQLPDVFVYLCAKDGRRLAFHRVAGAELSFSAGCLAPRSLVLRPSVPIATQGAALPSLTLSMTLMATLGAAGGSLPSGAHPPLRKSGSSTIAEAARAVLSWPPPPKALPISPMLSAYEVRLHVYQGRRLPPRDANGVLDPYVVASVAGVPLRSVSGEARTSVRKHTAFPLWYETLRAVVWLPPLNIAPDVVCSVWDWDVSAIGGSVTNTSGTVAGTTVNDDFVGTCRLSVRNTHGPLRRPRWTKLREAALHGGGGEVLVSVQLVPLPSAGAEPIRARPKAPVDLLRPVDELPKLAPRTEQCTLQLAVIGLRGVRVPKRSSTVRKGSFGATPNRPFVEIAVGSVADGQTARTSGSNSPSPINPTYKEGLLELSLQLPKEALYLPTLNVTVRDTLFGGLQTPELGVASMSLEQCMPSEWTSEAEAAAGGDPDVVHVETWEYERWYPAIGWAGLLLPADPPRWSSAEPPYVALPKDGPDSFKLPSREWQWTDRWLVDASRADGAESKGPAGEWLVDGSSESGLNEGWSYALCCHEVCPHAFGSYDTGDSVRRRCWVRTRVRVESGRKPTRTSWADGEGGGAGEAEPAVVEEVVPSSAVPVALRSIRGTSTKSAKALEMTPAAEEGGEEGGAGEEEGAPVNSGELSEAERRELAPLDSMSAEERLDELKRQLKAHDDAVLIDDARLDVLRPKTRARKAKLEAAIAKAEAELQEENVPAYLKGRSRERSGELEEELVSPFETVHVMAGTEGSQVHVCTLKALTRLTFGPPGTPLSGRDQELLGAIMKPRDFVVRVYVLKGRDLAQRDADSPSDPYLRLSLGSTTLDNRSEYLRDEPNPDFHRVFEFHTSLPGDSLLTIDVLDHDWPSVHASDDLIGSTTLDLEDRVFSDYWSRSLSDRPPIEWRSLHSPLSKREQGRLSMFVDIIREEQIKQHPPFDISLPPEQKWELRVIVWKGKRLPLDVDYSGLADWYVSCRFGEEKKQLSDTHFRAKDGRASWNWRFKFPVTLRQAMKYQRLTLQIWDKDLSSDDCGGEAVLDLTSPWFRRMFARKRPRPTYWMPFDEEGSKRVPKQFRIRSNKQMFSSLGASDSLYSAMEELLSKESLLNAEVDEELESAKFWLPLHRPRKERQSVSDGRGEPPLLLMSVQLVPVQDVEKLPAGFGRSAPNSNPTLPKPTGRLKFSWNPCRMMYDLLGRKLCMRLNGVLCCALCVVILWYMIPVLASNVITETVMG